ncbi:serine/threonine-protein kinase ATR-like isoform X2 [Tasmannia lanceolata]|uniref:serine/threonine-protein kinase ATR-like isoform X2 n=1 Tax=Tasmannia lanceolata TaxID=3420 RepID=UPI0040646791
MASLSSLVHELRERIAASSSSPYEPGSSDFDPLETRFRTVLPNLLQAYVLPSSTVLKLLSHTARNFPGVFYHGKASAILPIIGRILPFFSEPAFRSRHGVIFETIASLLSLLRTGEREAYRQFFLDAMLVVEDKSNVAGSTKVSLKCFHGSFALISSAPALLSDLPACCRPTDGPGVLIDLTDKPRWQPFATWTIKLLSKCLTEGILYVEGLINASFVTAACTLLCYGDSALHMACFDFTRITTSVIDADIVPSEKLIRSISSILSQDKKEIMFRNAVYDSSMGACLHVLHSSCQDDVVQVTAGDLVSVFPQSIRRTDSPELETSEVAKDLRTL